VTTKTQPDIQTGTTETPTIISQQTPVVEEVVLPKPDYKISGIVWNTDRPQAIIEGRIVDIGDSIEQWRIIGISRGGVEVSFKNQKFLIEP
jgi:type II secretory pathway component PulC